MASEIVSPHESSEIQRCARRLAAAQVDLRRIRLARDGGLRRAYADVNYVSPSTELTVSDFQWIVQNSDTADVIPPRIARALEPAAEGDSKLALIISDISKFLRGLDRYERRALWPSITNGASTLLSPSYAAAISCAFCNRRIRMLSQTPRMKSPTRKSSMMSTGLRAAVARNRISSYAAESSPGIIGGAPKIASDFLLRGWLFFFFALVILFFSICCFARTITRICLRTLPPRRDRYDRLLEETDALSGERR